MDIRHRLRLVRSWARWIIAGTLIAAVAAYLISGTLPKVYEADARLVVGQALSSNNPAPDQFATAQQLSAAYVALAGDRPVLESVIKRLNLTMSCGRVHRSRFRRRRSRPAVHRHRRAEQQS